MDLRLFENMCVCVVSYGKNPPRTFASPTAVCSAFLGKKLSPGGAMVRSPAGFPAVWVGSAALGRRVLTGWVQMPLNPQPTTEIRSQLNLSSIQSYPLIQNYVAGGAYRFGCVLGRPMMI
jgi:hypothetical protein